MGQRRGSRAAFSRSHMTSRGPDRLSGPVGTGELRAGCSVASGSRVASGPGPRCLGAMAQPAGRNDEGLSLGEPPAGLTTCDSVRHGNEGRRARPLGWEWGARAQGRVARGSEAGASPWTSPFLRGKQRCRRRVCVTCGRRAGASTATSSPKPGPSVAGRPRAYLSVSHCDCLSLSLIFSGAVEASV